MELEEAGGIKVLSDTLNDVEAVEEEKSEAAGLLAQVTSPWIENNSSIEGLSAHLDNLVKSLTSKLFLFSFHPLLHTHTHTHFILLMNYFSASCDCFQNPPSS